MSKKLWKFRITYKIKGLEKRWFNRYKKIEETDIEDGFKVCSSLEELMQNLLIAKKAEIIRDINEGYYQFIPYSKGFFEIIRLNELLDISIDKFDYREATFKEAIKLLSPTEIIEIYGENLYNKIKEINDER